MPGKFTRYLASLLPFRARRFGAKWLEGPEVDAADDDWALASADALNVPLDTRAARRHAEASAPLAEKRAEMVIATAALLGIGTAETREWVAARMLVSPDPAMHALARGLRRMWQADAAGRRGAAERNLQIACLIHAEILGLRAAGATGHDIRGRAAEIVRDRLLAANPETRPALRKRLLEIYRENEPRVLEIWPEMEALVMAR
jgi:hypothetical protein